MGPGPETPGAATLRRCVTGVLTYTSYVAEMLRAMAFWGTIFLPFAIVGGLATDLAASAPTRFLALVGLNVLCVLLGRGYRPSD
ncbi:hypothetical protein [Haloarcula sediminis]|uniref:hypothetical protein n=1 Tax=Haloarcula sediminis TaxID=3111777 RepID=UPI002D79E8CE|nr:hypothetical protein [Haloarcula sp. CK38]